MKRFDVIKGDITSMDVDAIVNSANWDLMGGGGVDGAIHRKAGPGLLEECRQLRRTTHSDGLQVGQAVITKGYGLPARYVIHTRGPVYGKDRPEDKLLADCYRNCIRLAQENDLQSIAFPSISTGVFGYPIEEAVKVVKQTLEEIESALRIVLVLFSDADYAVYKRSFS
jgi:O-acetyl-ADP-ribose deacetylase (regulator of RNase III)